MEPAWPCSYLSLQSLPYVSHVVFSLGNLAASSGGRCLGAPWGSQLLKQPQRLPSLPCSLGISLQSGWRTFSPLNGFIQALCPTHLFLSTSGKLSVPLWDWDFADTDQVSDRLVFSAPLKKQRTSYLLEWGKSKWKMWGEIWNWYLKIFWVAHIKEFAHIKQFFVRNNCSYP